MQFICSPSAWIRYTSDEKGLAETLSTWDRKDTDGWGKEITLDILRYVANICKYKKQICCETEPSTYYAFVLLSSMSPRFLDILQWLKSSFHLPFNIYRSFWHKGHPCVCRVRLFCCAWFGANLACHWGKWKVTHQLFNVSSGWQRILRVENFNYLFIQHTLILILSLLER